MMELIKDVGQTALSTGERALRLFWDLLAVASERLREVTGQPRQLPIEPPHMDHHAGLDWEQDLAPEPARPTQAKRDGPPSHPGAASAKPNAKARAKKKKKTADKGKIEQDRPDQMIRVLELLVESGKAWQSAKELSDAGAAAGTPILPGNVRKVIRARGGELIETRPREGSRRGALEYRITELGRRSLTA